MSASWKIRLISFGVPVLAVAVLLYSTLASLQISLGHAETLGLLAVGFGIGTIAGLLAAFGGVVVRTLVFAATLALVVDVAAHAPLIFDPLVPTVRAARARDAKRVDDLHELQRLIEDHIHQFGDLPLPAAYGEGTGPETFWKGWWDVSSGDGDDDGHPFLDFLIEQDGVSEVPVDPENIGAADGAPTGGRQYVFFAVPAGYAYEGGMCSSSTHAGYLLAVTDLETEPGRPAKRFAGSGCGCFWRNTPGFFDTRFDYLLCGSFEPNAPAPAGPR